MCSVKCDAQYIIRQRKVCTLVRTEKQHCDYAVSGAKCSNTKEGVILLSRLLIGIPTTQPTELCHTRFPLLCCEQQATLTSSLAHQLPVIQHKQQTSTDKVTHPESAATPRWIQPATKILIRHRAGARGILSRIQGFINVGEQK
jgi:hypothetical protein